MAQVDLSLVLETELVWDALGTVVLIAERLRSRHGDRFRRP